MSKHVQPQKRFNYHRANRHGNRIAFSEHMLFPGKPLHCFRISLVTGQIIECDLVFKIKPAHRSSVLVLFPHPRRGCTVIHSSARLRASFSWSFRYRFRSESLNFSPSPTWAFTSSSRHSNSSSRSDSSPEILQRRASTASYSISKYLLPTRSNGIIAP